MPSNYYRCPRCGTLELIHYRLLDVGGSYWPPQCRATRTVEEEGFMPTTFPCDARMELAPQPGDFAMDARSDGGTGRSFQKFSVDVDGRAVEIDSLHALRKVERESEQRYRNGEGEPLRFRMWSQTHSNRDVGAFGTDGKIGERTYDAGSAPAPRKKIGVRRHGQDKPQIRVAKGAGQSPLP